MRRIATLLLAGTIAVSALATTAYAQAVQFDNAPPEAYRAHGYALLKSGQADDGRRALNKYLELRPDAADAAMVRFSLGQ